MSFSFTITRIDIMVYSIPWYREYVYIYVYTYIFIIYTGRFCIPGIPGLKLLIITRTSNC